MKNTDKKDGPTLRDVINIIPEHCYRNPTGRGLRTAAVTFALFGVSIAALAATDHPAAVAGLWLVAGLFATSLFILGHDAAHGALFSSNRLCYLIGQASMLPSLHVYEGWVFGHNRVHHGHTLREGLDFVWHPLSLDEYRKLSWPAKLVHRLEWSWAGAGVYYAYEIWWKKMILFKGSDRHRGAIVRDKIVVAVYFTLVTAGLTAAGAWYYGTVAGALWLWFKLFFVPFFLCHQFVGAIVHMHHIAPDIQWFRRQEWTKFRGQVEGTTVINVPAFFNRLFLHNILVHVPHHVDMRIPFYHLPEATNHIREHFGEWLIEKNFRLRDYFRATRMCKLYDFAGDSWLAYSGTPVALPAAGRLAPSAA